MTEVLARTVDATRRYGQVLALHDVTVQVRAGELVGLLGPNGAGKTTLINLLVGLRRPTSGLVELFGGDPRDASQRRLIGVTPQETGLPETLRVGECVDYVAAHFAHAVARGELLSRFGLEALGRRQIGGLSSGQKRRLAVSLAFVGNPRLVFLDEPTTSLDVEARHALWDGIRSFHDRGGAVLLTSHYLEEVEELAQRVIVLGQGRTIADDSVQAIRNLVGIRRVSLTSGELPALAGVVGMTRDPPRTHLLTADSDQLIRGLVHAGVDFCDLEVRATSLEEAFLTITAPDSLLPERVSS